MSNKIWVVDDDDSIRWVLSRALKKAEFDVEVFADGESVLRKLEKDKPNVVMTDIRMPGVSGLELAGKLKDKIPDVPVIIMTAHTDLDSALSSCLLYTSPSPRDRG